MLIDGGLTFVCNGCLCCWSGIYIKTPDLIGCEGLSTLLCLDCGNKACKDFNSSGPQYLTLQQSHCFLIQPRTLLKSQSHCFCLYSACALPCDDDVPSILAFCCVVLYPKFGIAKKFNEIPHKKVVGAPPGSEESSILPSEAVVKEPTLG